MKRADLLQFEYSPWEKKFAIRRKMQDGSVIWFRSYYVRQKTTFFEMSIGVDVTLSKDKEEAITLFDVLKADL